MISRIIISTLIMLCLGLRAAAASSVPETGSGLRDTEILRQAYPAQFRGETSVAEFFLDEQSQALRDPAADHSKRLFDSSTRSLTNQVIFRSCKSGGGVIK